MVSRPVVKQKTLKTSIGCSGTGLHSGNTVTMVISPAEPGSGIRFRRTDITGGGAEIPATWRHVVATQMCTVIGNDNGVTVATVEHLMAALAGQGIDNAVIELNGPEVPVMDGSAEPFVFLIDCAGIVEQDAPRQAIRILKPVEIVTGSRRMSLRPSDDSTIEFEIDFESDAIARQSCFFTLTEAGFRTEIARARTFGFEHEVAQLRAAGLARGGSLANAVVISGNRVLNAEGLRFADEFVRHKVLDCVGDLYLAGAPILGHVSARRSGHAVNNQLLRKLFADHRAWRVETMVDHGADSTAAPWEREPLVAATAAAQ